MRRRLSDMKTFLSDFGLGTRKSSKSRRTEKCRRALRFEALESREMLSITVNTLNDENDGIGAGGISLREAIQEVVAGDTIDFAPSLNNTNKTINLTFGEIPFNKSLIIDASMLEDGLTIDASMADQSTNPGDGIRIFNITGSGSTLVTLKNLMLTGGDVNGEAGNNSVGEAGGIVYRGGDGSEAVIRDSKIVNNTGRTSGGINALFVGRGQGSFILKNTEISGNHAIGERLDPDKAVPILCNTPTTQEFIDSIATKRHENTQRFAHCGAGQRPKLFVPLRASSWPFLLAA